MMIYSTLTDIHSSVIYNKSSAEAALDELFMQDRPEQKKADFLEGEINKYDHRVQLAKRTIEKQSTP